MLDHLLRSWTLGSVPSFFGLYFRLVFWGADFVLYPWDTVLCWYHFGGVEGERRKALTKELSVLYDMVSHT